MFRLIDTDEYTDFHLNYRWYHEKEKENINV